MIWDFSKRTIHTLALLSPAKEVAGPTCRALEIIVTPLRKLVCDLLKSIRSLCVDL